MRRFIVAHCFILVLLSFALTIPATQAQAYPDRPIRLVIPGTPGSILDITGRLVAEELEKILGTQLVPLNKPGASFTLGTDAVARSKKDGYTIAYTNSPGIVYARAAKPKIVPYDPDKDLEPLGLHLFFPTAVAVQAGSPWKTFDELMSYAKAHPGEIRVSTSGKFPVSFYVMAITESLTGAEFTQVPYKGGQAVITALLAGDVEVSYDAVMKFIPHVRAGKLRLLMVGKKVPQLPDVPTLQELGYDREVPSAWFGFYGPAGLPDDVKKVLIAAIEKAINNPEVKAKIEKMGFVVDYKPPVELKSLAAEEYKTACEIVERLGIR